MKREEGVLLHSYDSTCEDRAHFEDGKVVFVFWASGIARTEYTLPADALAALTAELRRREGGEAGKAPRPNIALSKRERGGHSDWYVCFHCWRAFHVPTSGYFGDCDGCGRPTLPWPADPLITLRVVELAASPGESPMGEAACKECGAPRHPGSCNVVSGGPAKADG